MGKTEPEGKSKIPVNDTKMITTDKKFFWFTTKKENWPEPQTLDVFLEKQEESEIWYGKLASAYEEIEAGSIVLIYVPGKDRRLFGIAICVRKGAYENGKPDVILKGIKPVQGPLWKTIVEDPILRNSKPVKMNALGTLFPLTHEEGIHLIELAQVSLKDVSDRTPRKYWQISIGEDATMWDEWKNKNVITIGFKEVIEPVGEKILEMSEDEIKKLYRDTYPENPIPEWETDKIINFLQKMKEGHYVLIDQGGSNLGWGIIKSGPIYGYSQECLVYRQIEWKNTAMQESVTDGNKE